MYEVSSVFLRHLGNCLKLELLLFLSAKAKTYKYINLGAVKLSCGFLSPCFGCCDRHPSVCSLQQYVTVIPQLVYGNDIY